MCHFVGILVKGDVEDHMLTWTQEIDSWHASGFRIELQAPNRWALVDLDADQSVGSNLVVTDDKPLAVEATLSQCKRKAALVVTARRTSVLRRRHARVLLLTLATMILLLGASAGMNFLVVLAACVVAARSLGILLGTFGWTYAGLANADFYQ